MAVHFFFILLSVALAVAIFMISESREDSRNRSRPKYKGDIRTEPPVKTEDAEKYIYLLYKSSLSDFRRVLHFHILKWIKEGCLEAELERKSYVFRVLCRPEGSALERELFSYFSASEYEEKIVRRDFTVTNRRNAAGIEELDRRISRKSENYLLEEGYISEGARNKFTKEGKYLVKEFKGYREYLKKIDRYREELRDDEENLEIHIMFSALLGTFDTVEAAVFREFPSYYESGKLDGKSLELAMVYSKIMSEVVYPPDTIGG